MFINYPFVDRINCLSHYTNSSPHLNYCHTIHALAQSGWTCVSLTIRVTVRSINEYQSFSSNSQNGQLWLFRLDRISAIAGKNLQILCCWLPWQQGIYGLTLLPRVHFLSHMCTIMISSLAQDCEDDKYYPEGQRLSICIGNSDVSLTKAQALSAFQCVAIVSLLGSQVTPYRRFCNIYMW